MTQLELELTEATAEVEDTAEEVVEDSTDNYESALGKAIAYWSSGRLIPMNLAIELVADGYDVCALEARHLEV